MPKIIPNIREQLLKEAKRQLMEQGYGKTTIRSVASACDLGVGTVYNYFESKDMLIATFMAKDWKMCISQCHAQTSKYPKDVLSSIHQALTDFISKYQPLFCDRDAVKVFAGVFEDRHRQLRNQLVEFILPACKNSSVSDEKFLAEYIAESLLTWTVAGKSFDEQFEIISKIIK